MAAEVRLEKGLSEVEGWTLCGMRGTSCILLELPFVPFKSWMTEEIDNIAYRFSLTPVLAHLDRYEWYSQGDWEELLEQDDVIFPVQLQRLCGKRAAMKTAIRLIREGRPVLLGSDAHSLDKRPPRFAEAEKDAARQAPGRLRRLCPAERFAAGGGVPLRTEGWGMSYSRKAQRLLLAASLLWAAFVFSQSLLPGPVSSSESGFIVWLLQRLPGASGWDLGWRSTWYAKPPILPNMPFWAFSIC